MRASESVPRLVLPVGDRDHVQGPATAPVTLVEYGDYECPHCGAAYPVLQELLRRKGTELRFVFRNFPISSSHPHAEMAAEAAEAAAAQGRFWEMHDVLYEHQAALEERHLLRYAADLRLDVPRFRSDLTRRAFEPRVREDFMSGVRSGVNGTPTFYVDELRFDGTADLASLWEAVTKNPRRRA